MLTSKKEIYAKNYSDVILISLINLGRSVKITYSYSIKQGNKTNVIHPIPKPNPSQIIPTLLLDMDHIMGGNIKTGTDDIAGEVHIIFIADASGFVYGYIIGISVVEEQDILKVDAYTQVQVFAG